MPVDIPRQMDDHVTRTVAGLVLLAVYLGVLVVLDRLGLPEGALALVALVLLVVVIVGALPLFRWVYGE